MNNIIKNRKFKVLCAFALAILITITETSLTVQAVPKKYSIVQEVSIGDTVAMSISDNKIVLELEEIGFTKKEIYDLYKTEANKLKKSIKLPSLLECEFGEYVYPETLLRSLPSNPSPGTYYNAYFDINFKSLAEDLMAMGCVGSLSNIPALIGSAPKTLLSKVVIKYLGIGSVAIAGVGGILFLIDKHVLDAQGIRGYQTWYYGEDNHGGISWTPGYINAKPYY